MLIENNIEIIPPGEGIDVIVKLSPLRHETHRLRLGAGHTVQDILDAVAVAFDLPKSRHYNVVIGGHDVYREYWSKVRVKAGATVNVICVPAKNAFKAIFAILIAVVALVVAPWLAGPGLLGLTAGTTAFSIATGMIGAGISMAGSLIANALFPPATDGGPQSEKTKALYSIGGAPNTINPFGAIPVVLGQHRMSPPNAARPYTEIAGDDQYLRQKFVVGYGPIEVSDIRIGETPIDSFEDVEIEISQNHITTPNTLYKTPVFEESLSILLERGPDTSTMGAWSERTTADNITFFSIDLSAPNGLYAIDRKEGKRITTTLTMEAQYKLNSSGTWLPWFTEELTGSSQQARRYNFKKSVASGQYDIRIRMQNVKYSGKNTNRAEQIYWSAIRGRRTQSVINFSRPLTIIDIYIKATGELSGQIDTLNMIAKPLMRSWDSTSGLWVANQKTRNPADIFRYVLQGDANHRPVANSKIDLQSLQDWHTFCKGNGFTFEYVVTEQRSIYHMLSMVAAAGRASVTLRDGKWGVVWDQQPVDPDNPTIVQYFTPRNSTGFQSVRAYTDAPHAFRMSFINRDNNYLNDERIVYDDGYSASNATKFEGMDAPGATDPNLVWRLGRYQMAQNRLQRETYIFNTDYEHLICTKGDRISVVYDTVLWGVGQARVKSIGPDDVVTLDDAIPVDRLFTYTFRIRMETGFAHARNIGGFITGDLYTLTIPGAYAAGVKVGDLVQAGEQGTDRAILRVKSITPQADLSAQVECVDNAPGILQADTGDIPEFESNIVGLIDYRSFLPRNMTYQEFIYSTSPPTSLVRMNWVAPQAARIAGYIIQIRAAGQTRWRPVMNSVAATLDIPELDPGSYEVRIRSAFENGQLSGWYESTFSTVKFDRTPGDVPNFKVTVGGDNSTFTWDLPPEGDIISHYQMRYSPATTGVTWQTATILQDNITGRDTITSTRSGTFLIKAISFLGTESVNATSIISTAGGITALNVVATLTESSAFSGKHFQTVENLSRLKLVDDPVNGFTDGYYYFKTANELDLSAVYTSRVGAYIDAGGENAHLDFFEPDDYFAQADFFGSVGAEWDVSIEISTTKDNPVAVVTRASIGTYLDADGLIKTAANNVPRYNYNPADMAARPVLMAEEASTNLALYSGNIGGTGWSTTSATVTANAAVAPDGTTTAAKIDFAAAAGARAFRSTGTPAIGDVRTKSVWLWADVAGKTARLAGYDNGAYVFGPDIVLTTIPTRYEFTLPAKTDAAVTYFAVTNGSAALAQTGIYAWGAQDELKPAATSYIPTVAATVTRAVETITSQPTWTPWAPLVAGDFLARAYQFRAKLHSDNPAITPSVAQMIVTVDMPDRIIAGNDIAVPVAGLRINFSPPYKSLSGVGIIAQGMATGDYYTVTLKDNTGFTIIFRNAAGTAVARSLDYVAKGYGRVT